MFSTACQFYSLHISLQKFRPLLFVGHYLDFRILFIDVEICILIIDIFTIKIELQKRNLIVAWSIRNHVFTKACGGKKKEVYFYFLVTVKKKETHQVGITYLVADEESTEITLLKIWRGNYLDQFHRCFNYIFF